MKRRTRSGARGQEPTFIPRGGECRTLRERARNRGHDVPTFSFARLGYSKLLARTWRRRLRGRLAATSASRPSRFARCNAARYAVTVLFATRRCSRAKAGIMSGVLLCRIACTLVTRALDNASVHRRKDGNSGRCTSGNAGIYQVLFLAWAAGWTMHDNVTIVSRPGELRILINIAQGIISNFAMCRASHLHNCAVLLDLIACAILI